MLIFVGSDLQRSCKSALSPFGKERFPYSRRPLILAEANLSAFLMVLPLILFLLRRIHLTGPKIVNIASLLHNYPRLWEIPTEGLTAVLGKLFWSKKSTRNMLVPGRLNL